MRVTSRQGFTLIELSIVLVIIGLVAGGVLVGRDMIKAASIRATIAQADKFNTAVNVFLNKYGQKPGDMTVDKSASFGFFTMSGGLAGAQGYQDGNGLIEGMNYYQPGPPQPNFYGETLIFWRHLSEANLIDGTYGINGTSALNTGTGSVNGPVDNLSLLLPPAKLQDGLYFLVGSIPSAPQYFSTGKSAYNYFWITGIAAITNGSATISTSGITPSDAFSIDSKIDDGMPNSGSVYATDLSYMNMPPTAKDRAFPNTCVIGLGLTDVGYAYPTDTYNTFYRRGANDPSCGMILPLN